MQSSFDLSAHHTQMFYNALVRKGKAEDVQENDVDMVVAIHNEVSKLFQVHACLCVRALETHTPTHRMHLKHICT
jgi:hypothetical protein